MSNGVGLMIDTETTSLCVYPDEFPKDVNDITDTLVSLYAPLTAWRQTAVEYLRQDMRQEFRNVLIEIITELDKKGEAYTHFKSLPGYEEGLIDIYNALAADALEQVSTAPALIAETVDYVKKADAISSMIPYTWILKGFFEFRQGKDQLGKRAEDHFKNVIEIATKKSKPKFTFAGHVGLGITSYAKGNISKALDHFTKAITVHPNCSSTLRIAFAVCAFKLEQYDRARSAAERAIFLDPLNPNALVMFAMLDLVAAQKEKRKEARHNAYEYCMLALQIDATCLPALNQVANHYFHVWQIVDDDAKVISTNELSVKYNDDLPNWLSPNDPVQINGKFWTRLKEFKKLNEDILILSLQSDIPSDLHTANIVVEAKSYGQVKNLLQSVVDQSEIPHLKAESYYFLGRLHHAQDEYPLALEMYEQALSLNPHLTLASFGMGQLFFAQQMFEKAEAQFEIVCRRHPDDKDTQAYLILVRSFSKSEIANFEKIREVAIGFPYELDLWLIQGQLRYQKTIEYPTSLRCYEMAYSCVEKTASSVSSDLLLTLSVLYHITGNCQAAYDNIRRALECVDLVPVASHEYIGFKDQENDIFYMWSESICSLQLSNQDNCFHCKSIDLSQHIKIGDDLLLSDNSIVTVTSLSKDQFSAISLVNFEYGTDLSCRKKVLRGNFNENTLIDCFNYGRILEDLGRDNAACELYSALLCRHPSFIDCYLRLGKMAWNKGNVNISREWLSKALEIDSQNVDVNIALGDLSSHQSEWKRAKQFYEKANSAGVDGQDSRSMVSLGNMYYSNLPSSGDTISKSTYESHLKLAYKFYYTVLVKDNHNLFAAIGLGVVSAEKKSHEIARDIFSRIRESSVTSSSDNCVNLANVYLVQNRGMDAVHMYQSALRKLPYSPHLAVAMASLTDCLSAAHLRSKQHQEAIVAIKKSLHLNPIALCAWFNIALTREENAVTCLMRPQKSVEDIEEAMQEFKVAELLFSFLSLEHTTFQQPSRIRVSKTTSHAHKIFCSENYKNAEQHRQKAIIDVKRDDSRRRAQEEQHKRILDEKLREKALREEEEEKIRQARREKAKLNSERLKKLEEEKWNTNTSKATSDDSDIEGNEIGGSSKKSGKKRRNKKAKKHELVFDSDESDIGAQSDGDDNIGGGMLTKRKIDDVTNSGATTSDHSSDGEFGETPIVLKTEKSARSPMSEEELLSDDPSTPKKQRRIVNDDDEDDVLD